MDKSWTSCFKIFELLMWTSLDCYSSLRLVCLHFVSNWNWLLEVEVPIVISRRQPFNCQLRMLTRITLSNALFVLYKSSVVLLGREYTRRLIEICLRLHRHFGFGIIESSKNTNDWRRVKRCPTFVRVGKTHIGIRRQNKVLRFRIYNLHAMRNLSDFK